MIAETVKREIKVNPDILFPYGKIDKRDLNKELEKYNFKDRLNLAHVCEDNKYNDSFIVIGKKNIIVGIRKLSIKDNPEYKSVYNLRSINVIEAVDGQFHLDLDAETIPESISKFLIMIYDKEEIPMWLNILENLYTKRHKKEVIVF